MTGESTHTASEKALRAPAIYINYHVKSEVSIMLRCQLCSTRYTAFRIKNCSKSTSTIHAYQKRNCAACPNHINCDPILENHTFGHMQNLWEVSIENFSNFLKLTFFHILIKQLLSLFAVKFHTHSSFYLGDILSYIRPCSSLQCVGQQLTYKMGDLSIPKTKHFLVFRK